MREPSDFGCDAARAVGERVADGFAHAIRAADAVEEVRLEDAGDAEGGGCEQDAEGWGGADKEVLVIVNVTCGRPKRCYLRVCMVQIICPQALVVASPLFQRRTLIDLGSIV